MPRRAYDRSLRDAQAHQTRERILDAVIAALARQDEISFQALASAASVSVASVYRHFPSRDALMDATQEAIGRRLKRPDWPDSTAELEGRVPQRYAWFEANALLIRAILASPLGRELLHSVQHRREAAIVRAMAGRVAHLEARGRAVMAIVAMVDDAHTWRQLRDAWRISADDAAWAAQWAMETLLASLGTTGGNDDRGVSGRGARAVARVRGDARGAVSGSRRRAAGPDPGGRRRSAGAGRARRDDRRQ